MEELNNNAKKGRLLEVAVIDSSDSESLTNYTYRLCTGDIINITVADKLNGNVSISTIKI